LTSCDANEGDKSGCDYSAREWLQSIHNAKWINARLY